MKNKNKGNHTWQGGVQELFLAAPEVLSMVDPITKLYPFQLAAIPVQENLLIDVGTIVDLIRQRPELLQETLEKEEEGDGDEGEDSLVPSLVDSRSNSKHAVVPAPASKQTSLHLSRQEDERTLLIGLGVVVAVGAGLWCWTKHHHNHPILSEEDTYTAPGRYSFRY